MTLQAPSRKHHKNTPATRGCSPTVICSPSKGSLAFCSRLPSFVRMNAVEVRQLRSALRRHDCLHQAISFGVSQLKTFDQIESVDNIKAMMNTPKVKASMFADANRDYFEDRTKSLGAAIKLLALELKSINAGNWLESVLKCKAGQRIKFLRNNGIMPPPLPMPHSLHSDDGKAFCRNLIKLELRFLLGNRAFIHKQKAQLPPRIHA